MNRKLAAVMAIDVVGYSSLMAEDEEGTLARLQESRRDLINPIIAGHKGRIVKLVGDGALVEFPSVVEAVQAAVEIQRTMAERMADEPVEHRLALRIGINLGDVIVEGDDIYGDGVNIAARLEQLASPGGICVARNVHSQVKDKLALAFTPLGAQHVKNIPQPIIAYRLDPLAGAAVQRRAPILNRREIAVLAAALLLISGGGWWVWTRHESTSPAVATVAAPSVLPLSDKPSIAVLPFDNLSGDARWGRLVGGLVEDVITDLARHPEIFVIARNSSSTYGGKAVDVSQVGRDLGVRYVLEGSIQADGDRIRVTTQLIDTSSKAHIWAQRYDRPATDLFAVQDDITAHVANALGNWSGQLARAQRDVAKHKLPANLDAYDLYLLGVEQKHLFTKQSETEAIRLLKEAVKLDPGFARAWATLALAYSIAGQFGFMDGDEAGRQWRDATLHALRLDSNDPIALTQRACIRAMDGDLTGAKDDFERAIMIAPNDADVLALVVYNVPVIIGQADQMVELLHRALRLNPNTPTWYYQALELAEYVAGHYRDVIGAAQRTPLDNPESLMYLAMAEAELGQTAEAEKVAQRIHTEFPSFRVEDYMRDLPVIYPPAVAAMRDGAQKTGLMRAL